MHAPSVTKTFLILMNRPFTCAEAITARSASQKRCAESRIRSRRKDGHHHRQRHRAVEQKVREYLDDLDAKAMAETENGK